MGNRKNTQGKTHTAFIVCIITITFFLLAAASFSSGYAVATPIHLPMMPVVSADRSELAHSDLPGASASVADVIADHQLAKELSIILPAAKRNGCVGDDLLILLAIRKAENGRAGCEFGVKHRLAWQTDFDTQAGWAAATVVKTRARWIAAGSPGEFIDFLGRRYCPPAAHELNRNWAGNVKYFYNRFVGEQK